MLERKYSYNLDNWHEIITSMRPVYRNNKHFRIYQQSIRHCLCITKENSLLLVKQIQIYLDLFWVLLQVDLDLVDCYHDHPFSHNLILPEHVVNIETGIEINIYMSKSKVNNWHY